MRLAWAVHGAGPPLLVNSCWLSHLQYDWQSPVWRHFLEAVGSLATTVRYDERGFGLSDWDVADFSLGARVQDLEIVADQLPYDRFALMGMSAGAPVAIEYAARHPERVSRLILYGPVLSGCFASRGQDLAVEQALLAAIRAGWGGQEPQFRRLFTSFLIPGASEEQMTWLDELQRMCTSPDNAVASRVARQSIDVRDAMAAVRAPTLVLHARGDLSAPFDYGAEAAALIPGARLVPLDSRNHILLGDELAWPVFRQEVEHFLAGDRQAPASTGAQLPVLTAREQDIVQLAAEGLDNQQIAARLVISVRTVERHLQNVYLKAGLSGRTARTAVVSRYLSGRELAG